MLISNKILSAGISGVKEKKVEGFTFKSIAFYMLGFGPEFLERLVEEIDRQGQKQLIKVLKITRDSKDSELANADLEYTFLSQKIRTAIATYIPHVTSNETLESEITSIEKQGLEWATEMGIYDGRKLEVLQATFCSGLVHCAFPTEFKDDGKLAAGYSFKERVLCDLWIRALFANDEDRDVFCLVEHPGVVKDDNTKILEACKMTAKEAEAANLPPKLKSMNSVTQKMSEYLGGKIPKYFFLTLQQYLDSTVIEARQAFSLEWPSSAALEKIKEDSSGSVHAIALGAVMKKTDRDALIENTTLRYIGDFTAKLVESHNDVNSHPKEFRERLKKLITILQEIDSRWEEISGFIDQNTPLDAIKDKNLSYLVNFYRKLDQICHQAVTNINELPIQDALMEILKIIPSFNRVDILIREGKSPQDAYDLVAKRGNDSLHEIKTLIKEFQEDVASGKVTIPEKYKDQLAQFLKEANIWINTCLGWGSQDIWEIVIPRYNEALKQFGADVLVKAFKDFQASISTISPN